MKDLTKLKDKLIDFCNDNDVPQGKVGYLMGLFMRFGSNAKDTKQESALDELYKRLEEGAYDVDHYYRVKETNQIIRVWFDQYKKEPQPSESANNPQSAEQFLTDYYGNLKDCFTKDNPAYSFNEVVHILDQYKKEPQSCNIPQCKSMNDEQEHYCYLCKPTKESQQPCKRCSKLTDDPDYCSYACQADSMHDFLTGQCTNPQCKSVNPEQLSYCFECVWKADKPIPPPIEPTKESEQPEDSLDKSRLALRKYIQEHPEEVRKALDEMRDRSQGEPTEEAESQESIGDKIDDILEEHYLGNIDLLSVRKRLLIAFQEHTKPNTLTDEEVKALFEEEPFISEIYERGYTIVKK